MTDKPIHTYRSIALLLLVAVLGACANRQGVPGVSSSIIRWRLWLGVGVLLANAMFFLAWWRLRSVRSNASDEIRREHAKILENAAENLFGELIATPIVVLTILGTWLHSILSWWVGLGVIGSVLVVVGSVFQGLAGTGMILPYVLLAWGYNDAQLCGLTVLPGVITAIVCNAAGLFGIPMARRFRRRRQLRRATSQGP